MATNAIIGRGTTISYGDSGSDTSFTALAEVVDCPLPEISTPSKVPATHYLSGDFMDYVSPGFKDVGDIELELNYEASQTATLIDLVGVEKWWLITLPDGATYLFPGYISKLGGTNPKDNVIKQKVGLAIIGEITFTAGTA